MIKAENKHHFENLSNEIIGVALDVHKKIGPGYLESIYENALVTGLSKKKIKFETQVSVKIKYQNTIVGTHRLDLVVEKKIIIELKAVKNLEDIYFAQIMSYLKAADLRIGLLFNFSKKTLQIKRVVN